MRSFFPRQAWIWWPRFYRLPPTNSQRLRRCHQRCQTCKNLGHDGRLLPPEQGSFIPIGRGQRWWCKECIANGHPDCSRGCRGKARIRRWLVAHQIRHAPLVQLGGQTLDFHLPAFDLLIQVDKHLGPATTRQLSVRRWQQQFAVRNGLRLLRVHSDDESLIEKLRQALLSPRPR